MAENKNSCCMGNNSANTYCKDSVYVDVNRILDSCRDKDCFENMRVYLTSFGQEAVERSSSVRTKCAKIIATNITVDPVAFNKGFYQINITIYVKLNFEVCVCLGSSQEIEGIAVCEKTVILYGSEGSVHIYRSDECDQSFCKVPNLSGNGHTNLPVAVFEVADPIVLGTKIVDKSCCKDCCCCCDELPEAVCNCITGKLCESDGDKRLVVTLGFFSVVRIERPGQYLISAMEYSVPDKECLLSQTEDPCALFKNMKFPVEEFYPPALNGKCDRHR